MDRQEEFRSRLLTTFRLEAADHLQVFLIGLLRIEQDSSDLGTVASIYRAMHSLKGAASVVGHAGITQLCQALETYFSALQGGRVRLRPDVLELLHLVADHLRHLLELSDPAADDDAPLKSLTHQVEEAARGASVSPPPEPVPAAAPAPNPAPPRAEPAAMDAASGVRIAPERIAEVLWHSEQLTAARAASADLADEVRRLRALVLSARLNANTRSRTLMHSAAAGRGAAPLAGETDDDPLAALLHQLDPAIASIERLALQNQRQLTRQVTDLVEAARSLSLSPVQNLLAAFPVVVRDLAHSLGKQVRVEIEGGDLELDRRILDHLRAPLLHILRNAVGHGIEMPEQRSLKPPVGLIRIAVRLVEDQRVEVAITDDGAGIDREQVARQAIDSGHVSPDALERMNPQQRLGLVLLPGLSTREEADRISGRGLGLSIVQEKIEALGGSVAVESVRFEGTTFRLRLPLRVATLRGVLVECGEHRLVIPESSVHRVARIPADHVRRHDGRLVIASEGRLLPLAGLAAMLDGSTAPPPGSGFLQIVCLGSPLPLAALQVDAILREQEFILKQPLPPLQGVRWYLGMTVSGRGRVIPVLQPAELLRSLMRDADAGADALLPSGASDEARIAPADLGPISILIAEDSITSRLFLKNLLESQGYSVTCVGDGAEAWNVLKRGDFDILLTDVEMPSLDGYTLTERLRTESRFSELPIVLITALDSPEHRRRGIAAGADAYLVKNQFDHEQLLDTITRLVVR